MAGSRRRMQHGLQSGARDGCCRLATDPWQADSYRECTEERIGQVTRTALPSDDSADSHAFHFHLSFRTNQLQPSGVVIG